MYNEYTVKSGSNKWVNFLVDMHLRKLQTFMQCKVFYGYGIVVGIQSSLTDIIAYGSHFLL